MAGVLVKGSDKIEFANAAENGKEYMGSFGNIRITLTFLDDKVFGGRYEILGEDKSGERFAQLAIDMAKGQDVDDLPDITPKKILAASGEDGEEAKRYAKYASGALGFVTTRVHRAMYDGFLSELDTIDAESNEPSIPLMFRGLGSCTGCANLKVGGGCASPTGCAN